jgi:hypothetical protein
MKFSIRDLLLVTVIVALAVGAWLDRQYLATENARLQKEVAERPDSQRNHWANSQSKFQGHEWL